MLFRVKQNDRAMAVAHAGIARFGNDDKPFIALEIGIARQAGQQDEADRYYAQCVSYQNPALTKDCNLAAGKKADAGGAAAPTPHPSLPFGIPHFP
jgi:hypothetical protein